MNELELLRDADPVAADPTPAVLTRARAALVAQTTGSNPGNTLPLPARRANRRHWSAAVASAAAVA
ncbi:MAG: hypothetical protein WCB04_05945, partial [Mycobacteriales bacterium]